MANNLTGDFEAVVQVSVRRINGLLATLHQNGASGDAPLKLPHSVAMRVGDVRKKLPDVVVFGDWVLEYQRARESGGLNSTRSHLVECAPPGAAKLIEAEFDKLGEAEIPQDPPVIVRGAARTQLSSPTLSLPAGSTSEVTVHAWVRAQYTPDPGTTDLPQPVHGEVHATFDVRLQSFRGDRQQLLIQPSAQDGKIQFLAASGSGLIAADVAAISAQVRKAVRESFILLPVDLPEDFPFAQFKAVGDGPGQALALPIKLSGASPPAGNIQSVTDLFIGSSGFAFAVSKEHVGSLLQTFLDTLTEAPSFKVLGITITVSFSLAPLNWADGTVTVSGRVEFDNPGPNQWIKFSQALTLELDEGTQSVALKSAGEPAVDESFFIGHSTAVNAVRTARDNALSAGAGPINRALRDARTRLNNALRSFDHSASGRFTTVKITPDGIIVRGEIDSTAARYAPIIDIAETQQGQAFTALKSWIPGGRIERLTWSWIEYPGHIPTVWSGVVKSLTDTHRFIFPKPAAAATLSSICLRVEGTQIMPDGHVVSVVGGTTCRVPVLPEVMEVPSWWEPVTLPVWLPDSTAEAVLNDVIAGHISVQSNSPRDKEVTHNSLVYFADWRADKPLRPLVHALKQMRRKRVSLVVIVVLPAGTFNSRRREVEARLDSIGERFPALLLPAEDSEGGWSRTFAVSKTPSAHLINARRKFVWKSEGEAHPEVLAAALDEHLLPAPAPRLRTLRLTVSPGERAPDVLFREHRGEEFALHRLRGRELLLNFWQAWSAPCITELGRLQRLHKQATERAPFIVAFHGGKEAKALDEIRRRHALSFPLVQDADQRIARTYGVRCWPTTVSVNADGFIDHVQFGITHPHAFFADRQTGGTLSQSP
jgi:peroxiredoxin